MSVQASQWAKGVFGRRSSVGRSGQGEHRTAALAPQPTHATSARARPAGAFIQHRCCCSPNACNAASAGCRHQVIAPATCCQHALTVSHEGAPASASAQHTAATPAQRRILTIRISNACSSCLEERVRFRRHSDLAQASSHAARTSLSVISQSLQRCTSAAEFSSTAAPLRIRIRQSGDPRAHHAPGSASQHSTHLRRIRTRAHSHQCAPLTLHAASAHPRKSWRIDVAVLPPIAMLLRR